MIKYVFSGSMINPVNPFTEGSEGTIPRTYHHWGGDVNIFMFLFAYLFILATSGSSLARDQTCATATTKLLQ